jgi:phage FluMu gp28-like protein
LEDADCAELINLRDYIDSLKELPSDPILRFRILRFDPWAFLRFAVYTRDQVDLLSPVKPAPVERKYLKTLVRLWEQEPLFAVVKSRRLWCSWLFLALFLWDACMHRHRDIYIVSKKEEDADELVKRAQFIYETIPTDIWKPDLRPPFHSKENHLLFPGIGSGLHAVAQGADQLRQKTASGILMDEFAFWERDKDTYTAAKPTIEGGGRVTIVSTPPPRFSTDPSFFQRLCTDTIDLQSES